MPSLIFYYVEPPRVIKGVTIERIFAESVAGDGMGGCHRRGVAVVLCRPSSVVAQHTAVC